VRVRAWFRWNVAESPSLTENQRERLLDKLSGRIDSRGFLRVVADERRSQLRNRQAAVASTPGESNPASRLVTNAG